MKKTKLLYLLLILLLASVFTLSSCAPAATENPVGTPTELSSETPAETPSETPTAPVEEAKWHGANIPVGENTPTVYPLKYYDDEGILSVISAAPKRIVSLSPAITEITAALGCLDLIAGRTQYCDYPPEVTDITSIGDMYNVNIETVISLEPDIVIASAHTNPDVLKSVRDAGITAIRIFDNDTFESAYQVIWDVATIVGKETEAVEIIEAMRDKVNYVVQTGKRFDKVTVYYMVSAGEFGDYAATGDTFISEMIDWAGGTNSAAAGKDWVYSLEKLIEADPYIIITTSDTGYASLLPSMAGYKDLTAVREGRVYEMDANIISRVGPRLADGLEELLEIIHSEYFR